MVRSIKNPKKSKRKNKGSKKGEAAAAASSSSSVPSAPAKVWQPGVDNLEEGEELQFDPSAYNYLRGFNIGWPCLSYDIVHDSLGLVRTEFPHTVYGVAGTQAEQSSWNYIGIFKLSNIKGKKRDLVPAASADNDADMEDSDSSSDEDDDEDESNDAYTRWLIKDVWDFSSYLNALAESETAVSRGDNSIHRHSPIIKFTGHKDEGYAIDWSPVVTGRLVSGDCNKCIHLWEPTSDTWNVDGNPFVGHTASVEDLQWSPTEADVFASCSVDGTISIWDTRLGRSPAVSFKAHDADVNVISWNRLASCMIASGSDDGSFSIRDLRLIKGDSLVAHFTYHKQPVTSIEWSPHEASTLAVSSADHQLTIWDLSLERDEEEEAEFKEKMKEQANAPEDLPPQLLFVHQGQKDLKELHWHPQIPGMIISTAADGFNVLMPSNIETTLPSAAT
ncbi:Glutamate-rich WD repeat-containing protein 1 [Ananas comosus]|uniref:Glutamate-rich WD repeat-containing protein 1 n=1 Tax=Ananas comosus TaxID=4615 RepID=A0A199UJR3_ANACO|nr:Glutamate-rich WD repeat-containing protein 1 [Ananas comosus]